MKYYEIAPASRSYNSEKLLTYSCPEVLKKGQVVDVEIRNTLYKAVIINEVKKPNFNTKEIVKIYRKIELTKNQIDLALWLEQYYQSSVGSAMSLSLPKSLISKKTDGQSVDLKTSPVNKLLKLTKDQQAAIEQILKSPTKTHILRGDTGTGKTQVYIELAKKMIEQNKSVLILTPEISLTPQIYEQFNKSFKNLVITHSQKTEKDKRETWLKIRNAKNPIILIGTRSSLFYPIDSLGLVVVDEFHDSAYSQDQEPRYKATRVSAKLAELHDAKLVLGSATPSIEEYFYALSKGAVEHTLIEKPLAKNNLCRIHIVDLNDQKQKTKYRLLSKMLIESIRSRLESKEQVLVFINRRGSSRLILCQKCGWLAECERCNIPYVFHHDKNLLVCHTCTKSVSAPYQCKNCKSPELHFKSPGTKAIAEDLQKIFPSAKIGRYDKDNIKSERFSENHEEIAEGKIDILVGTQLLTKGHDLPRLTLAVSLLHESSSFLPDYKTTERAFALNKQLAGRVGRRSTKSDMIIQTYDKNTIKNEMEDYDNYDWIKFYNKEIQQRQQHNFPPYCFILKITVHKKNNQTSQKNASKIADSIHNLKLKNIELLGPIQSFKNKQNNRFYWQIVIKSKSRNMLLNIVKTLPKDCIYDIEPDNLI